MTLELRTLFLAATVAALAPVTPAPVAMTHEPTDAPAKQGDPPDGHPSAAEPEVRTGDSHNAADERQARAKSAAKEVETAAPTKAAKRRSKSDGIDAELRCLALNVYHEARSESVTGQEAVAAVTLNRVQSKSFPNSVCKVVKQGGQKRNRCQFSWWCDGKGDSPTEKAAWEKALEIGRESLLGLRDDPTHGSLYYHADHVRPRWSRTFQRTARIGDHIFYKPAGHRSVKVASAH